MSAETRKLREDIVRAIEEHGSEDICPSKIADKIMLERDPERSTDDLIWAAAHRHIRGVVRSILRSQEWRPVDDRQPDLFLLFQTHYPRVHEAGEEATYASLDRLTDDDIEFNIGRLRSEAHTKDAHADRLQALLDARKARAA